MKIIELYKDILSTANLTVDKEGNVSATMGENSVPFTVENKRLVLPTREHLSNPDWSKRIVFHPLSENILRSESKVTEKFRSAINTRLNYVIGCLMTELLTLVTSVDEHKKFSPDQADLLTKVKNTDEKTLNALGSILKNMGLTNKDKCIVHIFLKRGGTVKGKRYNRASIVNFPLYKELQKKEKVVYGVHLRARDSEAISDLLEYIIPGIDKDGFFDRGSESDIAPFLDALMRCLMGIAGCVNTIVNDYSKFITKPKNYLYSDDWVEVFDNLSQLLPEIRAIPMQSGNEGQHENDKPKQASHALATLAVAGAPVAPVGPPINMAAFHQAAPNPFPNMQPQQPPSAGPVMSSSGGLDFAATLRSNPGLAAATMHSMPGMQRQMSGPEALRNAPMQQPQQWIQPQQQQYYPQPVQQNNWQQPQQQQYRSSFGNV